MRFDLTAIEIPDEVFESLTVPCGPCTACCTGMQIVEIGKPVGKACPHLGSDVGPSGGPGCSIYSRRPDECRHFACAWKCGIGGSQAEADRPDNLGVVLDASQALADQGLPLVLNVFEIRPGAAQNPRVGEIVAHAGYLLGTDTAIILPAWREQPEEITVLVARFRPSPLPESQLSRFGKILKDGSAKALRKS